MPPQGRGSRQRSTDEGGKYLTTVALDKDEASAVASCAEVERRWVKSLRAADAYRAAARELQAEQRPAASVKSGKQAGMRGKRARGERSSSSCSSKAARAGQSFELNCAQQWAVNAKVKAV